MMRNLVQGGGAQALRLLVGMEELGMMGSAASATTMTSWMDHPRPIRLRTDHPRVRIPNAPPPLVEKGRASARLAPSCYGSMTPAQS